MSPCQSCLLSLYYYGTYPYRRWRNGRDAANHRLPVTVLFYHRVADDGDDEGTISNRAFARQIAWLSENVDLISLEEAQRRIRANDNGRLAVSITFDDGYAENCQEAIPLLVQKRIPCTYFVTAGNVLSGEPFSHDLARGCRFPPNNAEQLRAMAAAGIEIGVHGYSHADLGEVHEERELHREVVTSGEQLQDLLGRPMRYFAFPYGQYANLNVRAFQLAHEAGYEAICSAYGGYNFPGDDAFHLQRIHADSAMIRLKNRVTVDPRKVGQYRFQYDVMLHTQQAVGNRL
jgi:peptidoglycan/xylan/chitin deacetylase (PgdA/CDA1 family)